MVAGSKGNGKAPADADSAAPDLLLRGVVALESIAGSLAGLRSYVEANGVPGSWYERAQRGLGKARTCAGALRIWRASREAVGPGERQALREAVVNVVAGLAMAARPEAERRAWAAFVVDNVHDGHAEAEDARVSAERARERDAEAVK